MRHDYFESFAAMIEGVPAKAVFRAVEIERRMLEDDLSHRRTSHTRGEASVLQFCHFLEAVRLDIEVASITLPAAHVAFCRKVVETLVGNGELPSRAKERFNAAIASDFLKALTA